MSTEDKIVSLNDFKEDRKFLDLDGKPYTGFYTNYYDRVNDQQGYIEEYYKDGKLNGLSTWWYENGQKEIENHYKDGKLNGLSTCWYENGQIEGEGFFKDGIQVDDNRTELDEDENELPFTSNGPLAFIKNFCLTFFYILIGLKLSKYIFDVWL